MLRINNIENTTRFWIGNKNHLSLFQLQAITQPGCINLRLEQLLIGAITNNLLKTRCHSISQLHVIGADIKETRKWIDHKNMRIKNHSIGKAINDPLFTLNFCYPTQQQINPLLINEPK